MEHTKYLVIGAGISGLAFADWLRDEDYLVLEALDEVGGYCKTIIQDGFVWDYSGHFFHFKRPEIERYLVERMVGQDIRVVSKKAKIWYAGELVDFPFQKNIHQLPKQEFIDCLVDLYFKDEDAQVDNFKAMLYAKFGRSIAEKFLIPYNEKLYATDLSRLDVDAMGRFFPYADLEQIIANFRRADNASYNTTFTYPAGGAIEYVRALQQGVSEERIALSEPVLSIDLTRKVARTPKREIAFEHCVSAVPFDRLLRMCSQPHDPSIYDYNQVLVFNLGFDRKGPEDVHWMYFPQRDLSFYRLGFYDNIFGSDRLSMYVEIGHPANASLDDEAIQTALERVLRELKACGITDEHRLVSHFSVVLDPAYVHITEASRAAVSRQKRALATHGVYSMGRYGSWTYCSIEDNIIEARALADTFNAPTA